MRRGPIALALGLWLAGCAAEPAAPRVADTDPLGPRRPVPTAADRAAYVRMVEAQGVTRYVGEIHPVTATTKTDWTVYHYPVSTGAGCLDDGEFLLSHRRGGAPDAEVLLYLEGGGACWSDDTCFRLPLASNSASTPGRSGIFDREIPRNPVRDHDIVYASYCDGSVWSGDHMAAYGARHWGLRNLSAAMTFLRDTYGDLDRLAIVGSSAGGFGTLMAMGLARAVFPEAELRVLNDSGPGLENPALADEMGRDLREGWRFDRFMPDSCTACDEQMAYLIGFQLDYDDRLKVGMFSYRDDAVIGGIFLRMFSDYAALLRDVTDDLHDRHPDHFRRFFVEGSSHTIVATRDLDRQWPHRQRFTEWLAAFLGDDDAAWIDRR